MVFLAPQGSKLHACPCGVVAASSVKPSGQTLGLTRSWLKPLISARVSWPSGTPSALRNCARPIQEGQDGKEKKSLNMGDSVFGVPEIHALYTASQESHMYSFSNVIEKYTSVKNESNTHRTHLQVFLPPFSLSLLKKMCVLAKNGVAYLAVSEGDADSNKVFSHPCKIIHCFHKRIISRADCYSYTECERTKAS